MSKSLHRNCEARNRFAFAAQALEIGVVQREVPLELRLIGWGVVTAVTDGLLIAQDGRLVDRSGRRRASINLQFQHPLASTRSTLNPLLLAHFGNETRIEGEFLRQPRSRFDNPLSASKFEASVLLLIL
jgi:hypothetical protein